MNGSQYLPTKRLDKRVEKDGKGCGHDMRVEKGKGGGTIRILSAGEDRLDWGGRVGVAYEQT